MSLSRALRLKDISASHAAIIGRAGLSLDAQISALVLAAGGALWDKTEATSLYQSRTGGSTGASGQPVGIILDKSYMGGLPASGYIAGRPEVFAGSTTDASVGTGTASYSAGVATVITVNGSNYGLIRMNFNAVSGTWYRITFTIAASGPAAYMTTSGLGSAYGSPNNAAGSYTVLLLASATGVAYFTMQTAGNSAGTLTLSGFSVKSIPGNHLIAPADANRGVLQASGGILFDGTDDYYTLSTAINITTDMWVGRAFNRASAGINSNGFGASGGGVPYEARWRDSDNKVYAGLGGTAAATPDAADTATGSFVLVDYRDVTTETLRRNGAVLGSRAAAAVSGSLNNLGRINTIYNNGLISRSIIIPASVSASDQTLLERWLGQGSGVTL